MWDVGVLGTYVSCVQVNQPGSMFACWHHHTTHMFGYIYVHNKAK